MSTGTELPTGRQPADAARGAFERLRAFDGLFLRAEHLEAMQDYARDLALATGRAGGSGVVEGYGLRLTEDGEVEAAPGLAAAPDGRPLLATEPLTVKLEGRHPDDSTYYRVLLRPGTWHHGAEPVQGLLCDDPCEGGTTRPVLTAEGPWLWLEAVSDDRFAAQKRGRRSWLAAHLFTQEEVDARRWPPPGQRDLPDDWAPRPLTAEPAGSVCLGVVFKESGAWQLDMWAARRDRGASPPANRWGLGLRPWEVFVAQVLQFQAHLGELLREKAATPATDALQNRIAKLAQAVHDLAGKQRQYAMQHVTEIAELAQRTAAVYQAQSLVDLGFRDLPPAGFLPSPAESSDGALADIEAWLGPDLVRAVCTLPLGDLGEVLCSAQSRPRTLLSEDARVVDVYVPVDDANRRATSWVLFVRANQVQCTEGELGGGELKAAAVTEAVIPTRAKPAAKERPAAKAEPAPEAQPTTEVELTAAGEEKPTPAAPRKARRPRTAKPDAEGDGS